ncbi:MAG: hypothetical protein ACRD0W_05280 [Acidimicrobiales bacterium]
MGILSWGGKGSGGQNQKPDTKATAERLRQAAADEAAKSEAARQEATRRAQRIQPKRGK